MCLLRRGVVVLGTVLLLALFAGCHRTPAGKPAVPGQPPAPPASKAVWTGNAVDFEFITFSGEHKRLSAYAGQPLVLNFWAAWCGPCRQEFPEFQEVYKAHRGQFALVSVAVDSTENPRGYVAQQAFSWTFALDTNGQDKYSVSNIPATFFISRTGDVVTSFVGAIDKVTFEASLAKIL